jgi:hypothetical protein
MSRLQHFRHDIGMVQHAPPCPEVRTVDPMPTRKTDATSSTDASASDRRAIHAYLSEESHDVWHDLAERCGMSLSGFLEALARDFQEHVPDEGGYPRWDQVVRAARKVDAERRRRGRR